MEARIADVDEAWAQRYADSRVRHWNDHDIDGVLADFADFDGDRVVAGHGTYLDG